MGNTTINAPTNLRIGALNQQVSAWGRLDCAASVTASLGYPSVRSLFPEVIGGEYDV